MNRRHPIVVCWSVTETYRTTIPAGALADALHMQPAAFTPALLTEREMTTVLAGLLAEHTDNDSYQDGDTVAITDARPGPAPLTVAELLRQADELLDDEHAASGLSDTGRLLEQLVAAVRDAGGAA